MEALMKLSNITWLRLASWYYWAQPANTQLTTSAYDVQLAHTFMLLPRLWDLSACWLSHQLTCVYLYYVRVLKCANSFVEHFQLNKVDEPNCILNSFHSTHSFYWKGRIFFVSHVFTSSNITATHAADSVIISLPPLLFGSSAKALAQPVTIIHATRTSEISLTLFSILYLGRHWQIS